MSATAMSMNGAANGGTVALDSGGRGAPAGAAGLMPGAGAAGSRTTSQGGKIDDADAGMMAPAQAELRCQADATLPQRTDYGRQGPFGVGTLEVTFRDASRKVEKTDKHDAAPARTLVTTIYYPSSEAALPGDSAPLAKGGPFPLLMHSHGYSSSREEAAPAARRAASYGYIIVAPDFPYTNILAPGGVDPSDAVNQPGDVSYLINQVLAFSKDSSHLLANGVDETRIGAMGVSFGGMTTLLLAFHPKLHDSRIKAAMPIAALSSFFAPGFFHTRELPTLFLHGDLDAFVDYQENGRRAYMHALPNARLITVAKGTHAAFGAAFDKDTVPALNGIAGILGADPSNPDGLGCGAVADTINMGNSDGPTFVDAFGGPENFIETNQPPAPCRGDEYKMPALDPQAQTDIAVRSTISFFEAHLGRTPEIQQDACRYLLHELTKDPAVKLE